MQSALAGGDPAPARSQGGPVTAVTGDLGPTTLPGALARWSATRPDSTACVFIRPDLTVQEELSYHELDERTSRAAARLLTVADPGDRVILLLPHGADFLVAFLACLRAGIVAVPLYPARPGARSDRIIRVLQDCQAACMVVERGLADATGLLPPGIRAVAAGDLRLPAAGGPAGPARPGCAETAFLQYTSGSTGQPKGVVVGHLNLAANIAAIGAGFGVGKDDVIVSWLPMYHDMGLIGTALLPLGLGVKTVLLDTFGFLHDPLGWLRAIAAFGGTCSGGPDFGYRLVADRYDARRLGAVDLSNWRIAFNGAEPINHLTMDRFASVYARHGFRASAFLPCYGLAEATLFVAGEIPSAGYQAEWFDRRALQEGRLEKASAEGTGTVRLVASGRAAVETSVVIRTESGAAAPPGQVGEVCVQGPGVTRGYWGDATASSEVFQARVDGWGGEFLRTGDLGATSDGRLYVVGRAKDLIIVAGRNFHPHDLESAALSVAPSQFRPGGAAAVQLADERVAIVVEVRGQAATQFAAHPAAGEKLAAAVRAAVALECDVSVADVIFVSPGKIPKTSSGKVRRAETRSRILSGRLAMVARATVTDQPATRAPGTDGSGLPPLSTEEVLRQAVAARTGGTLRPGDEAKPLAALGFNSLALVALKNAVEGQLGRVLDSGLFFGDLSVSQIVRSARAADGTMAAVAEDGTASGGPPRLSTGQAQMVFYDQLFREDVAHNLVCALRFGCARDAGALRDAVAAAVAAHPALRTTLRSGATWALAVHPEPRFGWQCHETDHEDPAQVGDYFATQAYQRFDLASGPLVRAAAVVAPGSASLLLVCHHAIIDHWSFRIVAAQVIASVLGQGSARQAPELAAPAADWAAVQARAASSAQGRAKLAALAAKWQPLKDYSLLPPRPMVPRTANPAEVTDFDVSSQPTRAVYERARDRGFTPFVCVAASYLTALHRATGHEQVVIGTPHHGRTDARFAGTVGYLVNLMPLLGDFRGNPSPAESEDRTWRELRTSLAHADVPLSHLIRTLGALRQGDTPLFQATLTFQQSGDDLLPDGFAAPWSRFRQVIGGVEVEAIDVPPRDAAFPLALYGARRGDHLAFRLVYQVDRVEAAFAGTVREAFLDALVRPW